MWYCNCEPCVQRRQPIKALLARLSAIGGDDQFSDVVAALSDVQTVLLLKISHTDLVKFVGMTEEQRAVVLKKTCDGGEKKFCFGSITTARGGKGWDEGQSPLDLAKPETPRSIEEECCNNDGGKWRVEYDYVVNDEADETGPEGTNGCWVFASNATLDVGGRRYAKKKNEGWSKRRDLGHGGRKLNWFCAHPAAKAARLAEAEVALLRLYTGPLYVALNGALRASGHEGQELLKEWWTCITVLICACFKLSFLRWYETPHAHIIKLETKIKNIRSHAEEAAAAAAAEATEDCAAAVKQTAADTDVVALVAERDALKTETSSRQMLITLQNVQIVKLGGMDQHLG
jgi:hypothetical protein